MTFTVRSVEIEARSNSLVEVELDLDTRDIYDALVSEKLLGEFIKELGLEEILDNRDDLKRCSDEE